MPASSSLPRARPGQLVQGGEQALGTHRLEQVIDGVEVEGLHGIVVVGRAEDHRRRLFQPTEVGGQLDTVHARHADIGQHHIDRVVAQEVERLEAVGRLADHHARQLHGQIGEQRAQAVASQRLVIDDEDIQWVLRLHGRVMRTS